MNKLATLVFIVALAIAGYLLLAPEKVNSPTPPPSSSVSGTVEHSADSEQVDQLLAAAASSLISSAPENAAVFIMEPGDGAVVSSPLTVKFGITNMVVAPAGQDIQNSGHHHLLIDLDTLPDMDQPLPASEQIIHFGGGETETTIELEPGTHTLQLLLGNYLHIPHDQPVLSKKITVTVK